MNEIIEIDFLFMIRNLMICVPYFVHRFPKKMFKYSLMVDFLKFSILFSIISLENVCGMRPKSFSTYEAIQPMTMNQFQWSNIVKNFNNIPPYSTVAKPIQSNRFKQYTTTKVMNNNIFNDQAMIMYRPQTPITVNDGQPKDGECPKVRPTTNGYYTFKQYEGIWFKRYRSRVRVGEPFFKCAWIDYIDQGNNQIFIMDNLQNNQTDEWFRQNATTEVWANDPTTWTSTLANGVRFDTHLIYYDGNLGVAVIYSCSPTSNGGHQGIGNIYTRSPTTPLSQSYVDFLLDIFYQNGIYDTLPLHFVDQSDCLKENLPKPKFFMI